MRNSHKQDSQFKLIGASIPRKEDDRLLKGGGKFTDDVQIPHQLEMAVGRSPFLMQLSKILNSTRLWN